MLAIKGVACGYGEQIVIRVEDLVLEPSTVVAIVGRSGAGKSTILATLSGSLPLIHGAISNDGAPVEQAWLRRNVARTLQSFPLLHWLTVRQNLELAARVRETHVDNFQAILDRFSAGHLADRFPNRLSGGERARASLAQAAVTKPKLLLLDEPLTGLDPVAKRDVADALFAFGREEQASVLFVTHDLSDALRYASRVAVVAPGKPNVIASVLDCTMQDAEARILDVLGARA